MFLLFLINYYFKKYQFIPSLSFIRALIINKSWNSWPWVKSNNLKYPALTDVRQTFKCYELYFPTQKTKIFIKVWFFNVNNNIMTVIDSDFFLKYVKSRNINYSANSIDT